MFLSKINLQPSTQIATELAKLTTNGAYSAHQLLWRLFTEETDRSFLFRQEIGAGGLPHFYVLSNNKPVVDNTLFNVQTKEFKPQLNSNQRLAFKLRVNPTICIKNSAGKSQRHDVLMHTKKQQQNSIKNSHELTLLMHQAAQNWLANETRLANWGISLDYLPEVQAYTQHKTTKKNGQIIRFSSVDFEGLLTINNPEKFLQQYNQGFGRSKALGCGLMLIRPL